jgi:two-component system chemotaxis sensor kinase CheA
VSTPGVPVVKVDVSAFRATFFDEAEEHLTALEGALVELEEAPGDAEILGRAFRAAHSIKGGSGIFGFADIGSFTHALESLLDRLRDGSMTLTRPLAGILLRSVDVLRALVSAAQTGADAPALMGTVLAELDAALHPVGDAPQAPPPTLAAPRAALPHPAPPSAVAPSLDAPNLCAASTPSPSAARESTYEVEFAPGPGTFLEGMDPLLLLRNLGALGQVLETRADLSALPDLDALDPERCYLAWTVRLATPHDEKRVRDVFAFVEDSSKIAVRVVAPDTRRAQAAAPPAPVAAPAPAPPAAGPAAPRAAPAGSFRVSTEKVDKLIDLVGELVIAQSMIAAVMNDFSEAALPRLMEAVGEMERNTRELQERVMSVRMVPIRSLFARFPRVVRDLAQATGKQVTLHALGEDTEIDKMVIEQLADPLLHVLRNSIDHGIEPPEERRLAGKDEEATVTMSACHQGGSVHIEIADDGRGLDTARIRDKAVERGLISASDALTDDQVHALVFLPGFSTAKVVSNVSGRGVGMDVVKRNVEQLNGTLSLESRPGVGTRLRIKLPLTLAIIDGMTLRIGAQTFVLPLVSIVESFRPTREGVSSVLFSGEVVRFRGESVPLVRLHELWRIAGAETDPTRALVVIVETVTSRIGLLVDEILGQPQVVVKSLDRSHSRTEGVMGATILGDGRVALILDVQALARLACGDAGSSRAEVGGASERQAERETTGAALAIAG